MARITVEDCVEKIPNRFDLVMHAAQRARQLGAGAPLSIERDNDKNPVVALREIADETVPFDGLGEALIRGHQRVAVVDDQDDEVIELMEGEQRWTETGTGDAEAAAEASDGTEVVDGTDLDTVSLDGGDDEADELAAEGLDPIDMGKDLEDDEASGGGEMPADLDFGADDVDDPEDR